MLHTQLNLHHFSEFKDLLLKCAGTAMSSKLIHSHKDFFTKMVVDAVLTLDQDELNERLIGVKRIPGGAMEANILHLFDRLSLRYLFNLNDCAFYVYVGVYNCQRGRIQEDICLCWI
jgi:hypothetical protein